MWWQMAIKNWIQIVTQRFCPGGQGWASFNTIQSESLVDVHKSNPLHMDATQKSRSVRITKCFSSAWWYLDSGSNYLDLVLLTQPVQSKRIDWFAHHGAMSDTHTHTHTTHNTTPCLYRLLPHTFPNNYL